MTNNNAIFSDALSDAFAKALAKQGEFARRKDSITSIAGTVIQVANLATVLVGTDAPTWVHFVIAVVTGFAQLAVHAGTKGAITPSQEGRIRDALPTIPDPEPKPVDPAAAMDTLVWISEAVENFRAREFGSDGFGKHALNEGAEAVESRLAAARNQLARDI